MVRILNLMLSQGVFNISKILNYKILIFKIYVFILLNNNTLNLIYMISFDENISSNMFCEFVNPDCWYLLIS